LSVEMLYQEKSSKIHEFRKYSCAGILVNFLEMLWLGTARTIKFSSQALTDKVLKGRGFSGENEEVIRRSSLNRDIASPTRERPLIILKSLTKVT
jgi:hypothetical protein